MNLPSSICYSMSRASETQFGYTLRKELKKVNVFTSIFEPISFSRARQDSLTPSSSQPSSPSNWRSKASPLVPESAPEVKSHREAWKRLPNSSTADPSEKVASELVNAVIQSQAPPFFIPLTDWLKSHVAAAWTQTSVEISQNIKQQIVELVSD